MLPNERGFDLSNTEATGDILSQLNQMIIFSFRSIDLRSKHLKGL